MVKRRITHSSRSYLKSSVREGKKHDATNKYETQNINRIIERFLEP